MIVHSLSGPSGTGKSTSAIQFAYDNRIEAIIDDGLLIINGEKKAGISAKFEKNTLTAVRRAIFQDDLHKEQVLKAMKENNVRSILIIGTSDKMTKKIAKRLELEPIDHFHHIEDIRSSREIQMAKFIRITQGKHVMPVPYKQVEQNFFKRLIQRGLEIFSKNKVKLGETTIVQPDFHQELIDISKKVYIDLIQHIAREYKDYIKVDSISFVMKDYEQVIYLSVFLNSPVHEETMKSIRLLQRRIIDEFVRHFEFEPSAIKISIKGILKKG
ncbi:hypothetical protein D1B33_08415 [Lysinibacillus yapensis]|uniref:Asp23/Gls24 family envelope stress response protein n=1 Tax=Ureibacillus yapensis TaxID=2304605 RepID=A0A396S9H1_9BACL|nr:hypothetical protein [Lysinibacillus yapensis]RHW37544.1 hypothetical protein D1B33_08415 [Lysinibacillus yapensis]